MFISIPNSPYFNASNWNASRSALALANTPKGGISTGRVITGKAVKSATDKLRTLRFGSDKARQRAALLGLTVKTLRAQCKAEGMRASKATKAALVDMLLA